MKKADLILIITIIIIAGISAFFIFIKAEKGDVVNVIVDKEVKHSLPLDKDTEFTVQTNNGYNIIKIEDKKVFVRDADCNDKICVEHKKIELSGETIVCLPHKLVVEIEGEKKSSFDTVVG